MPRIGFIGVGNIGFPMARRLREAGQDLIVHDSRADRAREIAGSDEDVGQSRTSTPPAESSRWRGEAEARHGGRGRFA